MRVTEQYRRGQLYCVAKSSSLETKGDSGVEVLANEPYHDDETGQDGQYTYKVYHLGSRLPGWIAALAPAGALKLEERAWNAFPYCKTELSVCACACSTPVHTRCTANLTSSSPPPPPGRRSPLASCRCSAIASRSASSPSTLTTTSARKRTYELQRNSCSPLPLLLTAVLLGFWPRGG